MKEVVHLLKRNRLEKNAPSHLRKTSIKRRGFRCSGRGEGEKSTLNMQKKEKPKKDFKSSASPATTSRVEREKYDKCTGASVGKSQIGSGASFSAKRDIPRVVNRRCFTA